MTTTSSVPSSGPKADKFNPRPPTTYPAFWHLQAVNIIEGAFPVYKSPIWRDATSWPLSKVALIDNGADTDHPYLNGAFELDRSGSMPDVLDLTGLPMRAAATRSGSTRRPFAGFGQLVQKLDPQLSGPDQSWLDEFITGVENLSVADLDAPGTANRRFSLHGTACAGLLAARAPLPESPPSDESLLRPTPLVYYGTDPDGKLIVVTTSFGEHPKPLILAFLFAAAQGADVILVPRAMSPKLLLAGDDKEPEWRILREVILAVSRKIPVVCAAGNECRSSLVAPAALANEKVWKKNGVIAVAAMNFWGRRSSYSNYGKGLTVAGPSDDGETFNEDQVRLDNTDRHIVDFPYRTIADENDMSNHVYPYADPEILAIDIGGEFGFEGTPSQRDQINLSKTQYSGYFTGFGGTSAAAAIVAGVIALAQRKAKSVRRERISGPAMKKLVAQTARSRGELPHLASVAQDFLDENRLPKGDRANRKVMSVADAFGSGLIDAKALISRV